MRYILFSDPIRNTITFFYLNVMFFSGALAFYTSEIKLVIEHAHQRPTLCFGKKKKKNAEKAISALQECRTLETCH